MWRVAQRSPPQEKTPLVWIGALGFEERGLGVLRTLVAERAHVVGSLVLNYGSMAGADGADEERRRRIGDEGSALLSALGCPGVTRKVDPYNFQECIQTLRDFIGTSDAHAVCLFDLTCMTKIHAVALACFLSREIKVRWRVGYTTPETYSSPSRRTRRLGCRDVLLVPLSPTAQIVNERNSRGIVVPGLEADRLSVALGEVEPSGGVILMCDAPGDPNLRRKARAANKRAIQALSWRTSMQWKETSLQVDRLHRAYFVVAEEVEAASARGGSPVFLFPFGPKPLALVLGFELALTYARASWLVYSIPFAYDLGYTQGVSATYWLSNDRHDEGTPQLDRTGRAT